ncbi:MAG: DUF4159 domain-containing protein [Candidatus Latescibacterota bacterium]|nr:DUF4159 domain-containing protein [Candidatus Latescibacterota bacterium]
MNEQKKILYYSFGAAAFLHVVIIGFFSMKAALYLNGVLGVALVAVLWRATAGRRVSLFVSLGVALVIESIAWGAAYYMQLQVTEDQTKLIRFQAPPPILQKNFDLVKKPEISEAQMEMLASMAPPELPTDINAIADVSAVGSDLLGAVLPGSQVLGTFSGAKADELAFDEVEMIELTETAAPVQEAMSLRQELLDVQDLDFGRFQAILIADPENKRNIRGFFNMTVIDYDLADKNQDRFPTAVEELMRYMRDRTQINARIEGTTVRLSDPQIMKAPFLYMTGNTAVFQFSDVEKQNLGDYLKGGGFLYAEDIRFADAEGDLTGQGAGTEGTNFDRQFKDLTRDPLVLGSDGAKWQRIPKSHPLYFAFYDFGDGPPMGGAPGGNVFSLEMLELRGRIAVVFSDLNVSWYWGDPNANARERGLQFGVNLIVYALTQPGGIANVTQYTQ